MCEWAWARLMGTLPTACTASVWKRTFFLWTRAAISSMGNITPVSLLAHMVETMAVSGRTAFFSSQESMMACWSLTRQPRDLDATLGEPLAVPGDCAVLDAGGDDMLAIRVQREGGGDGRIIRLRAATGEDYLFGLAAEQGGDLGAAFLHGVGGVFAETVGAGWVAAYSSPRYGSIAVNTAGSVLVVALLSK